MVENLQSLKIFKFIARFDVQMLLTHIVQNICIKETAKEYVNICLDLWSAINVTVLSEKDQPNHQSTESHWDDS